MLDPDIKISRQVEDNRYDLDGTRQSTVRVEYFVGKHGPFVERFEKEAFSQSKRDDKLNAFAREVRTT